jgi:DeoR family transcriptional regulator, fructose operon transcriptional repressor
LSGVWAERAISEIRVDKAILGISSLDPSYGVSTARQAEAEIKKLLVKAAKVRIGLADHTKFGKHSFAYVGPVSDLSLIVTDSGTPPELVAEVEQMGVRVIIAQMRPLPSAQVASAS